MANITYSRTPNLNAILPDLVKAGLAGDRQAVEHITAIAIRSLRETAPAIALLLGEVLAASAAGSSSVRWNSDTPPPADSDTGAALVRIISPGQAPEPLLPEAIGEAARQFIMERRASAQLLREGISPPRSLLLSGSPGTGKTMLARWMAAQLGVKLVVLDLASAMSSYLGKTGSNLRRSLDFARGQPCVFLLDEFDAIAKRRDDVSEVGELKRIVNVLLKELEDWPVQSVLVAATNHPDLLDPAISRRFDVVLELPCPTTDLRREILLHAGGHFTQALPAALITALALATEGASGSALTTLTQTAVRRHIVSGQSLSVALVAQARDLFGPKALGIRELAQTLHQTADMSVREMAAVLGKSSSTIQYHLKQPPTSDPHVRHTPKKAHSRQR